MALVIDNIIIPESDSPCSEWVSYFTKLKRNFGTVNARMLWLYTWKFNGSTSCTTCAEFNSWLKRNKIDVSSAATRAIADISAIGGNVLGFGKNITKMMSIVIPVVSISVILIVLFFLAKQAKSATLNDVAMLHPAGRALAASKVIS